MENSKSSRLNLSAKTTVLRALALATLFSLLDSVTSAIMIYFRGVGFEGNQNVHRLYPTFGAISPLIDMPIEIAVFFILTIFLIALVGAWNAGWSNDTPAWVVRIGIGSVFTLADIFLTIPIISGAAGNIMATVIGNSKASYLPFAIFANAAEIVLALRNVLYQKSVAAGHFSNISPISFYTLLQKFKKAWW